MAYDEGKKPMQTLTVAPPVPFVLPPSQLIQIGLVGCGGTGSHLALALARIAYHVQAQGGPPLALTFIDGDRVERHNIGRQLFTAREISHPKAQVLADRLNAALGLRIAAVSAMATTDLFGELQPGYQTIGILVGAVDTASGRRAMHEALTRSRWRLWLDVGNEHNWGTVTLGSTTDPRDLHGAMALGGICTALPAPSLRYPHLLDDAPIQPRADCAHAAADGAQSLIINQAMAAIASHYVYQLVVARQITTCETALDLATLTMSSTPITAASIAEASGLTLADVTTRPETITQRKGSHL
ncbi:MAG: ThiF family adenylyltransferase [Oscillochloridaceae bacterium umkhey_bin13]